MGNSPITASCNPAEEAPKPKVLVFGNSDVNLDQKTVAYLVKRHGSELDITAGIKKSVNYSPPEDVSVVQMDIRDGAATMTRTLEGFDRVFIVSPFDNGSLTIDAIDACKAANVKSIVVLSMVVAFSTDTYFGRQYNQVEKYLKKVGPTFDDGYSVLRIPLYMDEFFESASAVAHSSTFYDPRNPEKKFTPVDSVDVAKCAADILADPRKHNGKTYKLVMPPFSLEDLAGVFSAVLTKKVTATKIPYKAVAKVFLTKGKVKGEADGITELYKLIDQDSIITNEKNLGDIERITGEKPLNVLRWAQKYQSKFEI